MTNLKDYKYEMDIKYFESNRNRKCQPFKMQLLLK